MKKILLLFTFSLLVGATMAQDIIYTISGEINNEKVPLDSILVENLSNNTWITFNNLPEELYYQINLTKKAYWGTTSISSFDNNLPGFVEAQNMPGEITLTYNNSLPTKARFSVFSLNGQEIYSSSKQTVLPGNSIQVKLAETGVFLIRVESDLGTQSFKGIGLPTQNSYNISVIYKPNFNIQTKSAQTTLDSDFEYSVGDSIRISVYKNLNFAAPAVLKIVNSDDLNFLFETNSDTTEFVSGSVNIEGVSNLDITGLTVQSINNTTPVKLNGTFQIANDDSNVEGFPLLVELNGEVLFGFFPGSVTNSKISVDNILLFYLKLHPDIANQGFDDSKILANLKADPSYSSLKDYVVESLNSANSPIDNEDFVNLYFESSKRIAAELNENLEKSASTISSDEDFIFKFNFSRDGKIEWDNSSKLFAVVGVEIMDAKENKVIFQSQLEPKSVIISVESIITFVTGEVVTFLNDLLTGENSDISSFNLPKEGEYTVSFTNGNNGLTTPEFQQKIKSRNAELLAFKMLTSAVPVGLKRLISTDKCWEAVAGLVSALHNTFVEMAGSNTYDHTQIPAIFYSLQKDGYDLAKDCLGKKFTFFDKIGGILKKLEPLSNAENLSNIMFMSRDFFGSEVTGKQTQYFYDGFSFGKLDYDRVTENEFDGVQGTYRQYGGKITEETTQYNIDVELTERKFIPQVEMLPAGGLPFYASLISGDAKLNQSSDLMSSTEGLIFLDLTMGEEEISKVKIEPEFKNSLIEPDTILLKYPICDVSTFIDTRDGKTYRTTKIGEQIWMAENLAYLPKVTSRSDWPWDEEPKYYVQGYNGTAVSVAKATSNYKTYGALYNWHAALIACPRGWHLPSVDEWKKLNQYINDQIGPFGNSNDGLFWDEIGKNLKAGNGWNNNGNGTDDYCFSGLPGGYSNIENPQVGESAFWWSSSRMDDNGFPWLWKLSYNYTTFFQLFSGEQAGFSVRCVMD